jgi:trehalose 6-phosphate phosphatase
MRTLFSAAGIDRLDTIVKPGMLCAFDFDGTLAPIVPQPDQVRLPEHLLQQLRELSGHTPLAIITGRSVADIRPRLGFPPDYLIGNHGLEGLPGQEDQRHQRALLCRGWLHQLTDEVQRAMPADHGVFIEDKVYSLSVHYRHAKNPDQAARLLETLFAKLRPSPHVMGGKFVFNLLPENAANKGSAFERLMQISAAPSAIYVGDDVTDEDVFRLRRTDILTVRIEASADSAAEFFVPDFADMARLLDELLIRLEHCRRGHRRSGTGPDT